VKSDFKFTVSSDKHVEETWVINPIRDRDNPSLHLPTQGGEDHAMLGGDGASTTLHVRGPHSLERLSERGQSALRMTFEIDRRADNGQLAAFSLNKVTSATCTVE